ncbi:MAG: hypothetical protein K5912_01995 [Alphaproteobacteria bacterium]|nr:hypothetical protein [Alphaproteobacteria bacterium]
MMKKLSKYYMFAIVALALSVGSAFADNVAINDMAGALTNNSSLCELLKQFKGVISVLRVLAFVGAAFVMMEWAWGFIQKGEVKKDDLKDKGIGLLVGFVLLFGVGMFLGLLNSTSFQNSTLGCVEEIFKATTSAA